MEKYAGTTPSGERYELRLENGKILLELLQYEMIFEPSLSIQDGKIVFSGKVDYHGMERKSVCPAVTTASAGSRRPAGRRDEMVG